MSKMADACDCTDIFNIWCGWNDCIVFIVAGESPGTQTPRILFFPFMHHVFQILFTSCKKCMAMCNNNILSF